MTLRNLNIAPRASLGFGLIALLVMFLGGFALLQMSEIRKDSDQMAQSWLPSVLSLGQVSLDLQSLRAETLRLMIVGDENLVRTGIAKAEGFMLTAA